MVDVVHRALAVADVHERAQHVDDVVVAERARPRDAVPAEAAVELHAAHGGEVVALRREEQVVEQVLRGLLGGRFSRAHHAVDVDQRFQAIARDVQAQGVGDVRAAVEIVGVDRLDLLDARLDQLIEHLLGELGVARNDDLAGFLGHDVPGEDAADQVFARHVEPVAPGTLQEADVARRHAAAGFDENVAGGVADVEGRHFAAQSLGHQVHREAAFLHVEDVLREEHVEDLLGRVFQGAQHHRCRQLAAPVDAGEHGILGVELEVEPRAAVGNHPGVVEDLAGRVGLALVMVEEDAGRAVQLRDQHALGAVDDEGAVVRHERDLAHVDLLLLDLLHLAVGRLAVVEEQLHPHAQRRGIGQAAHHAFADIERRLAELVVHVVQGGVARVADDGEHRAERGMEAHVLQAARPHALLEEALVGVDLDLQQVGDFHGLRQLAEVLADAFLLCEGISHSGSILTST